MRERTKTITKKIARTRVVSINLDLFIHEQKHQCLTTGADF